MLKDSRKSEEIIKLEDYRISEAEIIQLEKDIEVQTARTM